ncbi:MAG: hypothetical protein COA79_01715 [Planctomycetota bacterium]|nr:MAG: hypothetical protein COA79_01715 [Planctomycetota bacterium]
MSDVPDFEKIIKSIKPAPPLPPAEGKVIRVDSPLGIIRAIESAEENTTIIIAKGHYLMPRDCLLTTHRVTIRGETGDREDVILDSDMEFDDTTPKFTTRLGAPAIIKMFQATNITIADLTLANNPKYGLLFLGDGRIHGLKVYNVKFHNIWARGLKGTGADRIDDKLPDIGIELGASERVEWLRPRDGEIRHCLFVADTVKKNDKDGFDGDYIAGMDLMNVDNFTIADCAFIGIRGKNGGARGGVFIWVHSDNVTVENNFFYHCDKGVSLGNPSAHDRRTYHIQSSKIQNNHFIGGSNKAIEVDYGNDVSILNNTIESDIRKDFSAIQVLNMREKALVEGNTIRLHGEEPYNCCDQVTFKDNLLEEKD